MFSTYVVLICLLFFCLFRERLKIRFLLGIALMLACVLFIAFSKPKPPKEVLEVEESELEVLNKVFAIGFGLGVPVFITMFITISRYWSQHYGYNSLSFSIDTFMVMGLVELPFFLKF